MEDVLKHVVSQCIEQGLVKIKAFILDATHTQASSQKQKPLDVLRDAAKRLLRVVTKRHPKLEKKLPKLPHVKSEQADAASIMLAYLALLGETVEELLPDHEGAVSEKLGIAKQIIEDERLLSHKGILSAIDPDARFGWKSSSKSFFGYKEHINHNGRRNHHSLGSNTGQHGRRQAVARVVGTDRNKRRERE